MKLQTVPSIPQLDTSNAKTVAELNARDRWVPLFCAACFVLLTCVDLFA